MSAPTKSAEPLVRTGQADEGPLWLQVKQALSARIRDLDLSEHDRLPSEAQLCAEFGVSRTVVREAMTQMVHEGRIYRLQGKGAFVSSHQDEQNFIGSTVGFSGDLEVKRRTVARRILRQAVDLPTLRMQQMMQIDADEPVVIVDRVMSVDGVPRVIVRCAMLHSAVPGLERLPIANRSLYDTISRQYGIRLTRAERWVEAVALEEEDAALLEVEPGHPALLIESLGSSETLHAFEYYTAHFLTDRSRLRFTISGPQ
jgi:GntR family transcriptional regulator